MAEAKVVLTAVDNASAVMRGVESRYSAMSASAGALRSTMAGLAATLGVGAFISYTAGVITSLAALDDMAEKTGATVEGLSKISSVAKVSGADMSGVANAMVKLTKGLSGADEETKGAAAAIQLLGFNLKEFKALSADEQFLQIAKSLDKYKDGTVKTSYALALMGKAGADQLPLLKDLAQAGELNAKVSAEQAAQAEEIEKNFKRLAIQADALKKALVLGLLPSLLDTTDALVKNTKELGIWAGVMETAIGIVGRIAGVGKISIVDTLEKSKLAGLASDTISAKKELDAVVASYGKISPFKDHQKIIDEATFAFEKSKKLFKEAEAAYYKLDGSAGAGRGKANPNDPRLVKPALTSLPSTEKKSTAEDPGLTLLNSITKEYEHMTGAISRAAEAERSLSAIKSTVDPARRKEILDTAALIDQRRLSNEQLARETAYATALEGPRQALNDLLSESARAMLESKAESQYQIELIGKTSEEVAALNFNRKIENDLIKLRGSLMEGVNNGLKDQAQAEQELANATRLANQAIEVQALLNEKIEARRRDPSAGIGDSIKEYQLKAIRQADSFKALGDSTINGLEDRFTEFFSKGKTDWSSYVSSIMAEIFRLQVVRPFLSSLFTPGGGGGGGLSGIFSGIKSIFGFADGGDPPPGVPYFVGERGVELRIDKTPGTIIPNHALAGFAKSASGGNTNSQTINVVQNFTVGDVASITAVRAAVAGSERRIAAALQRSQNYGGAFA